MKVLITGGTGFIGSRLALRLRERGDEVRVLGQENTDAERANRRLLEEHGARVTLGSVGDTGLFGELFAGVDTVFHLAAAQHEANVPDSHFYAVNVEGTRAVLEAAAKARARRFVHGSTIGVYGVLDGTIDENSPLRPDNIYGITKREGENLALAYRDRLPVTVARISETYGPGDRRLLKLFRAIEKNVFFMIGDGQNLHHLIYVDDLIDGLLSAAVEPGAVGEVIVLSGKEPVTTARMVADIAAALGRKVRRLHVPLWPFLAAAAVLETTLRPLGIQPPIHRRRMDFFRKSFVFSQEKSQRLLRWRPKTGFAEGAAATALWYRENRLL